MQASFPTGTLNEIDNQLFLQPLIPTLGEHRVISLCIIDTGDPAERGYRAQ